MWHHVFLLFRRQPGKSALASSGFLLAACALILLSATTQTTVAVGNQIISQSWRSSYDLVVLPPQAQLASQSILPADLLEGYDDGSMIYYVRSKDESKGVAMRSIPISVAWSSLTRQEQMKRPASRQGVYFNALYQQHYSAICAFLHFLVGTPEVAEDLASLVFEKAWKHLIVDRNCQCLPAN